MKFLQVALSIALLSSLLVSCSAEATTALFVFGDSTVDNGNNQKLPTNAISTYPPYGVDFPMSVPTGRFCNGLQVTDFIAKFLGLPLLPPYFQFQNQTAFAHGANFASASSGVLADTRLGGAVVLSQQVSAFESAKQALVSKYGSPRALEIISKALYFVETMNNDVNNKFQARVPLDYESVIAEYISQIKRLHALGARKFVLVTPSNVGCIPVNTVNGTCSAAAQNIASTLISKLNKEIDSLRKELTGAKIIQPNFFKLMGDVNARPAEYGFENANGPCCQLNAGTPVCMPRGTVCPDRSKYAYFDAIHNTEAFNRIAANLWWSGSAPNVSPMNIRQLAAAPL